MRKVILDKTDGIAEVIDRILAEPDNEIVLVVPKGSELGKSARNFHLLKREMVAAEKTLTIESVDENILAFAKASDIAQSHPLWRGTRGTGSGAGVSDIVRRSEFEGRDSDQPEDEDDTEAVEEDEEPEEERPVIKSRSKVKPVKPIIAQKKQVVEEEEAEEDDADDSSDEDKKETASTQSFFGANRFFQERTVSDDDDEDDEGGRGKGFLVTLLVIVVLAAAFFGVTFLFGRAQVVIDFQQTPWNYQGNFVASKAIASINSSTNMIPAQVFTAQKNVTQTFPATGNSNVSIKAQGSITIYNAYSSSPQDLVATTRFATPDGKIFRLVNSVTVPGAQVVNGQLTPSSIQAPIIADQAGTSYNLGPVAKLTIPGFESTPAKYAGFYGAITGATSGGFVGNRPVPTAADIANAKTKTTAILQSSLQDGLTATYPNNFRILDGATTVQVSKLTVSTTTDANGNFSVFGTATLQAIGFDESALTNYLLGLAQTTEVSSHFVSSTLSYASVQANFTAGTVSFSLSAQGELEPVFSSDDFASMIAGKSIGEARADIQALPELADGKISVWPMWLWSIPSNTKKIQITSS